MSLSRQHPLAIATCHVWMEPDWGRSHSIHFPAFWITFCRFLQDLFGSVGSTASILWCWITFLGTWDHDFSPLNSPAAPRPNNRTSFQWEPVPQGIKPNIAQHHQFLKSGKGARCNQSGPQIFVTSKLIQSKYQRSSGPVACKSNHSQNLRRSQVIIPTTCMVISEASRHIGPRKKSTASWPKGPEAAKRCPLASRKL